MRWCSGGAGPAGAMHLVGLLAKALPAAPAAAARTTAAAGSELLYCVEWQALSTAGDQPGPAAAAADLPARPAARWTLGEGRAVAVRQRRGASDAAFAADNLALLQKVRE